MRSGFRHAQEWLAEFQPAFVLLEAFAPSPHCQEHHRAIEASAERRRERDASVRRAQSLVEIIGAIERDGAAEAFEIIFDAHVAEIVGERAAADRLALAPNNDVVFRHVDRLAIAPFDFEHFAVPGQPTPTLLGDFMRDHRVERRQIVEEDCFALHFQAGVSHAKPRGSRSAQETGQRILSARLSV